MATAAKATVSLHLDTTGIVEQLRGLADAIEAISPRQPSSKLQPVAPPFDAQSATCPEPGGCDSCPNPDYCTGLRVGIGITTVEQERAREVQS